MIKQDNRPNSDTFESRLNSLKCLLNEPTEDQIKKDTEDPVGSKNAEKSVFISVNGNNNIISAGKSQHIIWKKKKKNALLAAIICCMLFF